MLAIILTIIIVTITGFAIWFDFQTYQKRLRALLILCSGLFLVGFIQQPNGWFSASEQYALLTDGFDEADFKEHDYTSVYSLRNADKNSLHRTWIPAPAFLKEYSLSGSHIDIYGHGTNQNLSAEFQWNNRLQEPQNGLILTQAPKQVEVGQTFEISVFAKGAKKEDSISVYKDGQLLHRINAEKNEAFSEILNAPGPVNYTFEWLKDDSLFAENIHIRAVKPDLLTFGILTYSPSFEITYLINHFGERGHSFMRRSRIGENRFQYDAINYPASAPESFFEYLDEIDLLILDSREYVHLTSREQNLIKTATRQGLDVLLTAPNRDFLTEWNQVFSELTQSEIMTESIERFDERNWIPNEFRRSDIVISAIPLLNMSFAGSFEKGTVLHRFSGNEEVSIRLRNGNGSVTGQLFYKTYSWLIEGNQEIYNHFWSNYLSEIISLEAPLIIIDPKIPRLHKKMSFFLIQPSTLQKIKIKPISEADTTELKLTRNIQNPEIVSAVFWPKSNGWHIVEYENVKKWFYVYSDDDWKLNSEFRNYQNTIKQLTSLTNTQSEIQANSATKIPDWFWLIGFLAFQIILWAERKMQFRITNSQ